MISLFRYKALLLFTLYFLPFHANSVALQESINPSFRLDFKALIESNEHNHVKLGDFLIYKNSLNDLYLASPETLLWVNQGSYDNQNITAVLQLFANAKNSGLNNNHYNSTLLNSQWQQIKDRSDISPNDLFMLDTAISINLLHLLSDLKFGRVDPSSLEFDFKVKKDLSLFIPLILDSIQQNTIGSLANKVEPAFPIYKQLKKVLLLYRNKQTQPTFNKIKYISKIQAGDHSPQIIDIRQRLKLLGQPDSNDFQESYLYDEALVKSIKDFQFHHGLEVDGIIGKNTIKALNTPMSLRIQKIEFALERFRWLPEIQAGPQVIVNIPAFHLWAYDTSRTNNTGMVSMKVIVGKSIKRKSPVFTAKMYYIEFSPYWNIPKSITFEEIIPKLQENALYLQQQNLELVTGFHNNEQAISYTDESIKQLEDGELKLRQRPGGKNALGKVKFIFPNNYNVYLHDTPSPYLFKKSKRDLSHGCIRVEKPTELADFLLQSKVNWNTSHTQKAMTLKSPKQVRLSKAVPVIIFYSTALAMGEEVFFYNDIYGYDAKLKKALMNHDRLQ